MLRRTAQWLKTHRRRVMTHRSSRKDAKSGHLRSMPHIHLGENYEKTECIGHELEAFENFAEYADRYEASPIFRYTDDFSKLSIHEKMEAYLNRMNDMWKGKDPPALIVKLRHCVALAQCFEDLCRKDNASLADYTEDYQHRLYETVEAACAIARKVMVHFPDAPAAILSIARVCASVGEDDLEQRCLNLSSHLIEHMADEAEFMEEAYQHDMQCNEQVAPSSEASVKKLT
ncbi:queD protein [Perkinsela sp. CCAP 1560/4]|nr:queD protein [Perkinsela sp. CCAP 1560/4]|eukprot:KNH03958.1 queD protein [Perkinsela sp. CCAP 1560/4]